MCTSSQPVVSAFTKISSSTEATISGEDLLCGGTVTLSFHPPGVAVCTGEEIAGDRYYDLPEKDQTAILIALAGKRRIEIKAKYVGAHEYSRVDWREVKQ